MKKTNWLPWVLGGTAVAWGVWAFVLRGRNTTQNGLPAGRYGLPADSTTGDPFFQIQGWERTCETCPDQEFDFFGVATQYASFAEAAAAMRNFGVCAPCSPAGACNRGTVIYKVLPDGTRKRKARYYCQDRKLTAWV